MNEWLLILSWNSFTEVESKVMLEGINNQVSKSSQHHQQMLAEIQEAKQQMQQMVLEFREMQINQMHNSLGRDKGMSKEHTLHVPFHVLTQPSHVLQQRMLRAQWRYQALLVLLANFRKI